MNMKDLGLVPSVAQCAKDAEGTAEIIKEQIPRLRSRAKKRQSERSCLLYTSPSPRDTR